MHIWGIVVLLVVWLVSIFNKLVQLENRFKNSFAQIDVQLKRCYNLIPNLVETTRAYMAHERGTLEEVIVARNSAQTVAQRAASNPADTQPMQQMMTVEAGLNGTLGRLFGFAPAIPNMVYTQYSA